MATVTLSASARTDLGTGMARKLRRAGQLPAVIYGHGRAPQSLTLVTRDVERLLAQHSAGSTVIELEVDGTTSRTLIREVQRHPFKRTLVHIDFQELVAGEQITVSIPLRFVGTADGVRNAGGILEETMHKIDIRVDPSGIPEHIDVDVTPLTIGHSLHIRDLALPPGAAVLDDPDATICVCTAPKTATEAAPTEGEPAAGEPELIRKAKLEGEEAAK